jgi:hypothetical protein
VKNVEALEIGAGSHGRWLMLGAKILREVTTRREQCRREPAGMVNAYCGHRKCFLRNAKVPSPLIMCGPSKNSMVVRSGICIFVS